MATNLTGQSIASTFGQLLHVDGGATSTAKTVYDGDGTATGMTLSTTGVGGNGSALTNLNASNLATGTVGTARLGSGTADSTTYLRGDQTWATVSGVTSLNGQTGAITNTDFGSIGSYAMLWYGITNPTSTTGSVSLLASGATIAGTSLRYSSTTSSNNNGNSGPTRCTLISLVSPFGVSNEINNADISYGNYSSGTTFNTTGTTTVSGTWRVVGGNAFATRLNGNGYYVWFPLLWVRVS